VWKTRREQPEQQETVLRGLLHSCAALQAQFFLYSFDSRAHLSCSACLESFCGSMKRGLLLDEIPLLSLLPIFYFTLCREGRGELIEVRRCKDFTRRWSLVVRTVSRERETPSVPTRENIACHPPPPLPGPAAVIRVSPKRRRRRRIPLVEFYVASFGSRDPEKFLVGCHNLGLDPQEYNSYMAQMNHINN
jgi:hypothetical protein